MYIGRFAPSPSGRLHAGSALTGIGALLRAKASHGKCLIRSEDLDYQRCPAVNNYCMLQELNILGLLPEDKSQIFVQSHNLQPYFDFLHRLADSNRLFLCSCSRSDLKKRPCSCFERQSESDKRALKEALKSGILPNKVSLRISLKDFFAENSASLSFTDGISGEIRFKALSAPPADTLTLIRADGIISYNTAVTADDSRQGVTEVVRGADMLEATFLQYALYTLSGLTVPSFMHLPLLTDEKGNKLSKQNRAPAVLQSSLPHEIFTHSLHLLRQQEALEAVNREGLIKELDLLGKTLHNKAGSIFKVNALLCRNAEPHIHSLLQSMHEQTPCYDPVLLKRRKEELQQSLYDTAVSDSEAALCRDECLNYTALQRQLFDIAAIYFCTSAVQRENIPAVI